MSWAWDEPETEERPREWYDPFDASPNKDSCLDLMHRIRRSVRARFTGKRARRESGEKIA